MPATLPHFDHHQHLAVAAEKIEFSSLAANVAREHREATGTQVFGRERLGRSAALPPQLPAI